MAFKRSAVRSRLSPPNEYYSGKSFGTLAVFVFSYLQEQENIAIIIKNEAFRER